MSVFSSTLFPDIWPSLSLRWLELIIVNAMTPSKEQQYLYSSDFVQSEMLSWKWIENWVIEIRKDPVQDTYNQHVQSVEKNSFS